MSDQSHHRSLAREPSKSMAKLSDFPYKEKIVSRDAKLPDVLLAIKKKKSLMAGFNPHIFVKESASIFTRAASSCFFLQSLSWASVS